ncbi:MAG TPA: META domain-containing protein [Gemmatimonadaceae bacterium]|nr:META domain-containing protein [Gemmatimonadaceae bacterium]
MSAIRPLTLCLALGAVVLHGCARNEPDAGTPAQDAGTKSAPQAATGAASDSVMPQEIADVTWQWVSFTTPVEQITVDAPEQYTIQFGRDGRIAMRADCNRGMGSYSVTADRRITMGPIALTRAMCPEGSLSDRFAREAGRAAIYFMREGDLYLDLPMDSGTLRFRRAP